LGDDGDDSTNGEVGEENSAAIVDAMGFDIIIVLRSDEDAATP
jgi:hypothetical protein